MDKNEFMNQLREGLDGNVSYEKYRETIEYYEAYFRCRMAEGKTEQEIVAELGSGRLIAKTIVETAGNGYDGQGYGYDEPGNAYTRSAKRNRERADGENTPKGWHVKVDEMGNTSLCFGKLDFSTTLGKIVIGIGLVLLLSLIVLLVIVGVKILIYVVIPVAVILFLVNLILSLIDNNRR